MRSFPTGVVALVFAMPALAQHAPHAHGVAELRVAADGPRLQVELDSPLDNLVGFEHAPKNAREREALAKAEEKLRDFGALFTLPPAAGCELQAMELVSPFSGDSAASGKAAKGAHADLHAAYTLECAKPQALDAMEVKLGEAFPRIRSIRAEKATPSGQGAVTLRGRRGTLPL